MELTPTIRAATMSACQVFGVTAEELRGPDRHAPIARPRQVAITVAYIVGAGRISHSMIGRYFKRDHTTVAASIQRVDELCAKDQALADAYDEVLQRTRAIASVPVYIPRSIRFPTFFTRRDGRNADRVVEA